MEPERSSRTETSTGTIVAVVFVGEGMGAVVAQVPAIQSKARSVAFVM